MYMFALLKTIGKGPNYPPGSFYAADLYPDQRFFCGSFVRISQKVLLQEVIEHPLPALVTKLELSCYFIMGDYDYMTSSHAAKEFFDKLEAKQKEFIAFDQSAHYPQFEEKEKLFEWVSETFL